MGASFDAIILGTGQATVPMAQKLASAGWKVAVVERKVSGNTSINVGHTPAKSLLASAQVAHYNRRAEDFGVVPSIAVMVDMERVKRRMSSIAGASRAELETSLRNIEGCTVYAGHPQFVSASEIRVNGSILKAAHILVDVGATPSVGGFDLAGIPYLTSSTILDLDHVPQKLVVIGGGPIGLECAQMYRRFGADVTVVERNSRLVVREDQDASKKIQAILEAEGVEVCLGTECTIAESTEDGLRIMLRSPSGEYTVSTSHLLLAIGRTPNTADLAVENAGLKLTRDGHIPVDMHLRSSVPGIWALGECNGGGASNDTSFSDFEIIVENLLSEAKHSVADRCEIRTIFTDPPLAQVGMTEEQARSHVSPVLVGFGDMNRVETGLERSTEQGFMKIFVDGSTQQILGATILGAKADEAIHSIRMAMVLKAPAGMLGRSMHTHPTVADLISTILGELKPLI